MADNPFFTKRLGEPWTLKQAVEHRCRFKLTLNQGTGFQVQDQPVRRFRRIALYQCVVCHKLHTTGHHVDGEWKS